MHVPRVNSVGVVEYPQDFAATPRRTHAALRVVAGLMLVVFAGVVVATTVFTIGQFCLTSSSHSTAPDRMP